MRLLSFMMLATILSACPLSDLALVESHPYASEVKGKGEKANGIRSFREINQTMSRVTGVDSNNQQVLNTYTGVKEMLPLDNAINSFSGPVQVGMFRLASEYCGQMLNDRQLRQTKLPEIDFSSQPAVALAVEKRSEVASLFIDKFWGQAYRTSAEGQLAVTDLVDIIDQEMLATNNQQPTRGQRQRQQRQPSLGQVLLSLCTATLASAPLMFY